MVSRVPVESVTGGTHRARRWTSIALWRNAGNAIPGRIIRENKAIVISSGGTATGSSTHLAYIYCSSIARGAVRGRSAGGALRRTRNTIVGAHVSNHEEIDVSGGRACTQVRAVESHVRGVLVAGAAVRGRDARLTF